MRDRLAERLALLDVGRDVVEHGLAGADGQRAPGQPGEPDAVAGSDRRRRRAARSRSTATPVEEQPGEAGGPQAHRRVGLERTPGGAGLDEEQRGARRRAARPTTNSSASAPRDDPGLHAVEHEAVARALGRRRPASSGSKSGRGLGQGQGGGGDLVAGERREVGRLLLVGPPQRRARWPRLRVRARRRPGPCRRGRAPRGPAHPRRPSARSAMPPRSSGTPRIGSPISREALSRSSGARHASLASAAAGRTISAANSVTTSTSICSSSPGVRSKSPAFLPGGTRCAPRRASRPCEGAAGGAGGRKPALVTR